MLLNHLALSLERALVLLQKKPYFEVLPFNDALHRFRRVPQPPDIFAKPHDNIVLKRHDEPRASRIALPSRPALQLKIDAAALVAIGPDDMQTPKSRPAFAEHNIGAAARHIGGYGDCS